MLWNTPFASAAGPAEPAGWIRVAAEGDTLHVVPYLQSGSPRILRYEMTSIARGPGATSRSRQSGTVQLTGEPMPVAHLTLRNGPHASYSFELKAFDGDTLVLSCVMTYP